MIAKEMQAGRFVDNEVTELYFQICSKQHTGAGEKHHVLPVSMFPEYRRAKWNIVKLTYQDHYKVHEILPLICIFEADINKMARAWNIMCHSSKCTGLVTPELYEELKQLRSNSQSGKNNPMWGRCGELNPKFGYITSEETKKKQSEAKLGELNSGFGVKWGAARVEKASLALMGDKNPMFGRLGNKNPLYGKSLSEETKYKISEALLNRNPNRYIEREIKPPRKGGHQTKEHIAKRAEGRSRYSYEQYTLNGELVNIFIRSCDFVNAGFTVSGVTAVCSGKEQSHYGFFWKKIPKLPLP